MLYVPPGPWRVYALAGGAYVSAEDFESMPASEAITSCVRRVVAETARPNSKDPDAVEKEAQFLKTVALCAAAFAAVYAAIVVAPRVGW